MGRHALDPPASQSAGRPARTYARLVLPAWLMWLLPVPVATLAAVAWSSWSTRARGPQDPEDTVAQYARFRAALAGPPRPGDERAAPHA